MRSTLDFTLRLIASVLDYWGWSMIACLPATMLIEGCWQNFGWESKLQTYPLVKEVVYLDVIGGLIASITYVLYLWFYWRAELRNTDEA